MPVVSGGERPPRLASNGSWNPPNKSVAMYHSKGGPADVCRFGILGQATEDPPGVVPGADGRSHSLAVAGGTHPTLQPQGRKGPPALPLGSDAADSLCATVLQPERPGDGSPRFHGGRLCFTRLSRCGVLQGCGCRSRGGPADEVMREGCAQIRPGVAGRVGTRPNGSPEDKSPGWTFTKTGGTDAGLLECGSSKPNPGSYRSCSEYP